MKKIGFLILLLSLLIFTTGADWSKYSSGWDVSDLNKEYEFIGKYGDDGMICKYDTKGILPHGWVKFHISAEGFFVSTDEMRYSHYNENDNIMDVEEALADVFNQNPNGNIVNVNYNDNDMSCDGNQCIWYVFGSTSMFTTANTPDFVDGFMNALKNSPTHSCPRVYANKDMICNGQRQGNGTCIAIDVGYSFYMSNGGGKYSELKLLEQKEYNPEEEVVVEKPPCINENASACVSKVVSNVKVELGYENSKKYIMLRSNDSDESSINYDIDTDKEVVQSLFKQTYFSIYTENISKIWLGDDKLISSQNLLIEPFSANNGYTLQYIIHSIDYTIDYQDTPDTPIKPVDVDEIGIVEATCDSLLGDPSLAGTPAYYLTFAFKVVRFVALIILIVMSVIDFVTAIASHDEDALKKAKDKLIKRFILAILIFLLPTLIEFILKYVSERNTSLCMGEK